MTRMDAYRIRDGYPLSIVRQGGRAPTVVFLCGLRSDMTGRKASFVADHCARRGQACLRFDYRGHGVSAAAFEDHSLADWLADAAAVLDKVVTGRFVLAGSSMGAWLAVLAGRERSDRLAGLLGIAAAPDFTTRLIEPRLAMEGPRAKDGVRYAAWRYGDPMPITGRLIADGRRLCILDGPVPIRAPVHLLHGQEDEEVPWTMSLELAARLESPAVTVELIRDGDHRLSRASDLDRIGAALDRVLEQAA